MLPHCDRSVTAVRTAGWPQGGDIKRCERNDAPRKAKVGSRAVTALVAGGGKGKQQRGADRQARRTREVERAAPEAGELLLLPLYEPLEGRDGERVQLVLVPRLLSCVV